MLGLAFFLLQFPQCTNDKAKKSIKAGERCKWQGFCAEARRPKTLDAFTLSLLAGCLLTTVSVAADKTAPCTAAAATAAP